MKFRKLFIEFQDESYNRAGFSTAGFRAGSKEEKTYRYVVSFDITFTILHHSG